ncbi:family S53 protease-like protein [Lentinus tigrinus ALCF2SS1-7]|uniref:family S53 protease-like protein n=1 Tax=Lentinus tigrinus ALCF2SS1-7 TaxID=1328758 RepID=UPI0011660B0C|nr:family S53 protease-like protein [Lentinus tigrinus ALCF2SS1-7]
MFAAGLLVLFLVCLVSGRPTAHLRSKMALHERRTSVPDGFKSLGAPDPGTLLDLRFAFVQSDPAGLENALFDVSTPGSKNFRKFLTWAQVEKFVAPKPESVNAVQTWLKDNDIVAQAVTPAGDWISAKISVAKANAMLDADFQQYSHVGTNTSVIRTHSYSIPANLKGHLDFVHPATTFIAPVAKPPVQYVPQKRPKAQTAPGTATAKATSSQKQLAPVKLAFIPTECINATTPACLQDIYNIPPTPGTQSANNSLAVASFLGETADPKDLTRFLAEFRPDIDNSTTFAVKSVDGGVDNGPGTGEASLDIQYTVGLATGVPTTFVDVGPKNEDGLGGFLDIIDALLAEDTPPNVLTTSFGFNEADIPPALAQNLCNAYAQLGSRGTSVLFASGDGGVSGAQPQDCQAFEPTFPSTCPFVTSVGGTVEFLPEIAAPFSSGGFSNIFPRPTYQNAAVDTYLQTLGNIDFKLFNKTGRAFPDVSMQANVSGTSAASPSFASLVALLNDRQLAQGEAPLGFLNPFLYSLGPGILNDITQGSNPGCGTEGFPAEVGWDPVTGLGTPDFINLFGLILASKQR